MDYWNFIKSEINSDDNMFKFSRTKEVEERYFRFRRNVTNVYQHLMDSLFKNDEEIVFKENDFPYKFDCKILHYIIWINPNNKEKIKKKGLITYLSKNLNGLDISFTEYILFKNNPINKSVETIEHYHVLIKIEE